MLLQFSSSQLTNSNIHVLAMWSVTWSWKLTDLVRSQWPLRREDKFVSSIEKENWAGYCPTHSHLPSPLHLPPQRGARPPGLTPAVAPSLHRTKCLLLSRGVQNARMRRPSVQGVAGVNGSLCSSIVDPLEIQSKERHPVM